MRLVVLVCGSEGVTAGELASREGIRLAQRREVVVVALAVRILQCVMESVTGRCCLCSCYFGHFIVHMLKDYASNLLRVYCQST